MDRTLDIAIAGAGIGGLASATFLARAGHRVRVFDQFDTPRPIGSGLMLQQTGLAVLSKLGLREQVDTLGSRIERLWGLTTPSGRTVLDVRYRALSSDMYGLGVQRGLLFQLLLEAALSSGVELAPSTRIRGASAVRGELVLEGGARETGHDLTVLAYGARPFADDQTPQGDLPYGALWATLPWPDDGPFDTKALEQRYFRSSKMTGVMASGRTEPDSPKTLTYFWSIRADQEADWRRQSLDIWKQEAAALWPDTSLLLDQLHSHDQLTFARYRHATHAAPVMGPHLFILGDAWHASSPQLGQGANMALLDAWALSMAIEAAQDLAEAGQLYLALRRHHVRLYQAMSWLFTPVYQGDSRVLPWLRDWLAAPLSRIWPAPKLLAAMVSGTLGRPLRKLDL